MNFPPQGRPRLLAPHFLRAPPMRFRSAHAQLRNRLALMATREDGPSDRPSRIGPVKRALRRVGQVSRFLTQNRLSHYQSILCAQHP
jgi:hypothetical protein